MFSRIAQSISFVIVLAMTALAQAQSTPNRQAQLDKTSVIIGRQLVRFVTSGEIPEWRLEVANQQGDVVFDSGFVFSPTLEWSLLNGQGEAVASGLYGYTLAFKEATSATPRLQRGHIILDRPSQHDRIWVTSGQSASIGADSDEVKLTVVGGVEATLGGAEFPGGATRRDGSEERSESSKRASNEDAAAGRATVDSNAAQKDSSNTSLKVYDGLSVNGNIIFTPNPMRDIAMQNNSGGLRFYGAPSLTASPATAAIQLWGNNSGFPGHLYLDAGATNQGALIFRTALTGGTITERMRVSSSGNVGIGTTSPDTRLDIHGIMASDNGVALKLFNSNASNFNRWYLGTGGAVVAADAFSIGDTSNYKMTILSSGNVGIGTTTPQSRLDVRGDIRLGSSGQYRATSGEENLRIVRGVVSSNTGAIVAGVGFSVWVNPNDRTELTIYFNTPFASAPTVIATLDDGGGSTTATEIFTDGITSSQANLKLRTRYGCSQCDPARGPFHFMAIGPR